MITIAASIEDRYNQEDQDQKADDLVVIVSVSSSPHRKQGKLPCLITLMDYEISQMGKLDLTKFPTSHIKELDLSDNKISDWAEVNNILQTFPSLVFLNLARNLLSAELEHHQISSHTKLAKLVLNGNSLSWPTVSALLGTFPALEELRLSSTGLTNPQVEIKHNQLQELFLALNNISDFSSVLTSILQHCPRLEVVSLSDCPISSLCPGPAQQISLRKLNLSDTAVADWEEVERLRTFSSLTDLRMMDCPFNKDLDEVEKRQQMIARLPNIEILNGGDKISESEREEAERNFIRHFLEQPSHTRPVRWSELTSVHGTLEPLVKIDLSPRTVFQVGVWWGEEERIIMVSVRQRVRTFKALLAREFPVLTGCMRLWYYDQDHWATSGPQEMKWPAKGLYTYGLQDGDYFVVQTKHQGHCGHPHSPCLRGSPDKKRHKLSQPAH